MGQSTILEEFLYYYLNGEFPHYGEIRDAIDELKVVKKNGKWDYIDEIIGFVYANFMKLKTTEKVKGPVFSATFVDNVKGLMYNKSNTHHSHITRDTLGYSHSYYNLKVRENTDKISVTAHNLFRFDFFFFLKGVRTGSWRTKDISKRGKDPTNINFANIGNQVVFIDTIKYFQQSLAEEEKEAVKIECKKFILKNQKLVKTFNECTEEDQEWVLTYLSYGKCVIFCEIITKFDSLDISPEVNQFFLSYQFYSSLKETIITDEDYKTFKKFYQTMKLVNLGELNKLYNFQVTMILCKIFESRASQLQKLFKFNLRKCNSASSFSGCVHRDKSKCLIALSTEAEHVRVFDKTLIGGLSCLNTCLVFDSQIVFPKDNVDKNKLIFDLKLKNNVNEKKRITAKILKMDEYNRYSQAMTKLCPPAVSKK